MKDSIRTFLLCKQYIISDDVFFEPALQHACHLAITVHHPIGAPAMQPHDHLDLAQSVQQEAWLDLGLSDHRNIRRGLAIEEASCIASREPKLRPGRHFHPSRTKGAPDGRIRAQWLGQIGVGWEEKHQYRLRVTPLKGELRNA
jgi:hypothetical protein